MCPPTVIRALAFPLLIAAAANLLSAAPEGDAPSEIKPSARQATYKLRPMDVVKIQVFQESELDRELRVSQDYTIVVPLIGVVNVKGRSVRDTELLLTRLYKEDYLVNPQINITVVEYSPRAVNVLGAVNSPGTIEIPPEKELSLLDIIARCGGFSRLANRTKISLTRILPDGQTTNFTINADLLVAGDATDRMPIQDGDVISVPERML